MALALAFVTDGFPKAISATRFSVVIPDSFEALTISQKEPRGNTKWIYGRRDKSGQPDYRFRVYVVDGVNPLRQGQSENVAASGLLAVYTRQLTRTFTGFHDGVFGRLDLGERIWWWETWTCRSPTTPISGATYTLYSSGALYVLVFESLSPSGENAMRDRIVRSFRPKPAADRPPGAAVKP